ncbi:MAG TPA: exosortase/archaeosortase family protein [Terriglobales bacterium]|nr:exosortase/archaeosortase family protein [Terriglobales bacterium]
MAVFLLLHTSIVAFGLATSRATAQSAGGAQFPAALAAAKYLVLLPTVFLLPWKQWRSAGLAYRDEWIAAAVALVTLYPYRIFAAAWPWYAQGLGHLAHALARPFVAGLSYIAVPTPTLSGPHLDVRILFACSGLEAIKLFQIVFIIMLVLDWVHLNKRRILFGYFGGMAVMLAANAVRIAFLAVTGNLAPRLAITYHLTLGWVFFACVAAALIVPLYSWLMPRRVPQVLAAT